MSYDDLMFKVTLKCELCEREKTYTHDKDEFRKKKPINKQLAVFFHLCELCDAPMRKIPLWDVDGYLEESE
tara:strand:+ start:776 stop:988 length:213 start_codon:yes stop_codon:yes gene_type:complete